MFGGEDRESLLGVHIDDFIASVVPPSCRRRLQSMANDPWHVPTIQERFKKLDGTPFDVEVSAVPFTYEGEPAVFVVAHDITERTRLEKSCANRTRWRRSDGWPAASLTISTIC